MIVDDDNEAGWRCDAGGDESGQVYPINDLRPHIASGIGCWCLPQIIDGIVVHNSMDGREKFETGERRTS